ncbi:MAG TPA: ATP-binding cassette domain-containing protein [Ilumatobacteraceae bacterium]|nr:ATP-binding cassette domain-containing protein [Ilumatobacteraceae bacterium]
MSDAIILATGLTKVYAGGVGGDVRAVDAIDLEIRSGEIYGLLGPNGAGKSTTIGMLTTRVVPTSGSILIGGVDLVSQPALAKQLIGVVPQSNTLDRAMTVFENLEFHGRYFGMSAKQARGVASELLQRVRLVERSKAPVMALSGGMAQRLMVARAIMHRPQVLFLDEPTAGLDPQSRIALWEILGDLHKDGQTILLTTHYMEEADEFCDRVAVMDHGHILALDTPAQLKASVGAGRVVIVSASGDLPALADTLVASVEGSHKAQVFEGRILLSVDDSPGLLPRIIDAAEAAGSYVNDLSVTEPTLESVFINLTGKDLRE